MGWKVSVGIFEEEVVELAEVEDDFLPVNLSQIDILKCL